MILSKWKLLSALAVTVCLAGNAFGQKPQPAPSDPVKKPDGTKPGSNPEFADLRKAIEDAARKGENVDEIRKQLDLLEQKFAGKRPAVAPENTARKPVAPDEPKPVKPGRDAVSRTGGKIVNVNAKTNSFTIMRKGDGGLREVEFKLTPDAVITIDGQPGKFESLKPEMTIEFTMKGDGLVSELSVTGQKQYVIVKTIDGESLGHGGKGDQAAFTVKLAKGGKVMLKGREAKLSDIKVGDRVLVVFTADESEAVLITDAAEIGEKIKPIPGDKPPERPGVKPMPKPEK